MKEPTKEYTKERAATSLVKPNRPRFTDIDTLVAMVKHGDSFGVGGHHFARLPIALGRVNANCQKSCSMSNCKHGNHTGTTQEQFARIENCLPRQRGNVSLSNLQVVNAMLHVAEHGCKW